MLGYYDAEKALTLQVDTSSTGPGAALIQKDGPIAYAKAGSRSVVHISLTLISFTGTYEPTIGLLPTSVAS